MSAPRPQEAGPVLRLPSRSRAVPTTTRMATRRVPALAVPALALLLGGGVVVAAQTSGHWATTGRDALASSASPAAGGGGAEGVSGTRSDASSLPATPTDVKGWMTLQQVLDAGFPGVTEGALRSRFAIPATVGDDTALKDLDGSVPGFDVATLRTWLSEQK